MEPQKNLEFSGPFEVQSGMVSNPHEVGDFGYEQKNNSIDQNEAKEQVMQAFAMQPIQERQPQTVLPAVQDDLQNNMAVSVPATAKDIDLMEDEWVRDIKKMIIETKDNPYAREVRFKEMQIDYLKKRYNRIINGGK